MDCPLDCEFLREARKHEKPPVTAMRRFPNQDVKVSEEFLDGTSFCSHSSASRGGSRARKSRARWISMCGRRWMA